ncbi:hypothetical protein KUTeg_000673 [Tegillarca granosa]|uniref:Uncharacterized protein n=1 Tax=Tegillarca granosa TaxID=220873 RepID=A0ABQ9FZ96_TEGGR|nr:hypothetical protein KUTeg_000673 [Tegillarca granosa]
MEKTLIKSSSKLFKGANKGFMVSTYAIYDGRIKAYQGDVESITNTGSALSRQLPLKYNYITSLTADPHNESIYFLDVQFHSIYKLDNVNIWFNNSQILVTRLHKGISIAIGSIVFDWISRNIYWTDRYHNWISMMPVTTRDPLMIRAVVEESISVPVALAVDPKAGLLFWSDTQPSARIEWSNLLGENRTVMLSGNMQFIIALAVDPDGQRIYFTDYIRSTLEVAEYGGHNRTVLTRLNTYKFVS